MRAFARRVVCRPSEMQAAFVGTYGGRLDVERNRQEVGNPFPRIRVPALGAGAVFAQPVVQMLAALTVRPRQLQTVGQRRNPGQILDRILHAHANTHREHLRGK